MNVLIHDLIAYAPQILAGLENTLLLAAIVSLTGFCGGIVVFSLTLSRSRLCRSITEGYISFFIGTPLLVHLFLMYYGLPELGLRISPLAAAAVGFTLNISAYNARHLMTAYRGLDRMELEAARAAGFTEPETFRLIVLPQALRLAVPALTNQATQNLKDTSVAFLIQYKEFFSQVQEVAATNFEFFRAYLFTGLVYLALVALIVVAARRLERRIALPGFSA